MLDGHGSIRQSSDASGALTGSNFSDAYGMGLNGSEGQNSAYGYTGQRGGNGGLFLRARDYDTSTGRFLCHDPLLGSEMNPSSLQRYRYAGNDPVNFSDPSGKSELAEVTIEKTGEMTIEGCGETAEIQALTNFENFLANSGLAESSFEGVGEAEVIAEPEAAAEEVEAAEAAEEGADAPGQQTNPQPEPGGGNEEPPTDVEEEDSGPVYVVAISGKPQYVNASLAARRNPMKITALHIFAATYGIGERQQPSNLTRGVGGFVGDMRRKYAQSPKVSLYGQKPPYPLGSTAGSPGSEPGTWDEYPFSFTNECGLPEPFEASVWLTPEKEFTTQGDDITGFLWDSGLMGNVGGRFRTVVDLGK